MGGRYSGTSPAVVARPLEAHTARSHQGARETFQVAAQGSVADDIEPAWVGTLTPSNSVPGACLAKPPTCSGAMSSATDPCAAT